MPSDYRLVMVLRAVSRLTQNQGTAGNESIINRGDVAYRGQVVKVPLVSANALRHSAVREPGGLHLIGEYGLGGRLTRDQLRLLISGGNNASESGGVEDTAHEARMRACLPLLSLAGCGLPRGPRTGRLKLSDAVMVCDENRPRLEVMGRDACEWPPRLRRAQTLVGKFTNYRHDATGRLAELLSDEARDAHEDKGSGMIFGGEYLVPGTMLLCEIHVQGASVLELGALAWSLRLWQRSGGYIGGQSARGHGRTVAMVYCDDDLDAACDAYLSHVAESRDAALAWIEETLGGQRNGQAGEGDGAPGRASGRRRAAAR